MNGKLVEALADARRGFYVLPVHTVNGDGICTCREGANCQYPGKHPHLKHWQNMATRNVTQIKAWWRRWPNANIGIHCGKSGLLVVDIDPRNGGDETWHDLKLKTGLTDDTVTSLTGGGGRHFFFKLNGTDPKTLDGKLGPGVDLKRGNGMIVAPGSDHVSGRCYEWEVSGHPDDRKPANAGPSLLNLAAKGNGSERAPAGKVEDTIPDGKRNDTLTSLAGTMRRRGMNESAILAALQVTNETQCSPPLDHGEVEQIAKSVARYKPEGQYKPVATSEVKTPVHLTDMGNSTRFARQHADDLRYIGQWGWLVWDSKRWARDDTGAVMRAARQTVSGLYAKAQRLESQSNALIPELEKAAAGSDQALIESIKEKRQKLADRAKAVLKWALQSQGRTRLTAMVELGQSEKALVARPEWFDGDPWLLNVDNGTLNLQTLELKPHDPDQWITKLVPVAWKPDAQSSRWEQFLREVFDDDTDLIDFVQRRVGYSLTGNVQEQEFALLWGRGANGKSTFVSTILAMMGDYAQTTRAETLLETKTSINNDVAALAGARLVVASELPEHATLNESLIKDLTGNDSITARFLYKEYFTFRPQFKLWLYGNHKPRVRGTDDAIWRRVNLVEFGRQFTGDDADPQLASKLQNELAGILAWAVRGCQRWQAEGLHTPEAVDNASRQYRTDQDVIGAFVEDCCVTGPNFSAYTGNLFEQYSQWTEDSGEYTVSKRRFGQKLRERGFTKDRSTGNAQLYRGIGLGHE